MMIASLDRYTKISVASASAVQPMSATNNQAQRMPTKVGGHVDIIRLAADGAEWLQRKDQCAAHEARPAPQVPVLCQNSAHLK